MQFSTMEKIRKVSLSGRENSESLDVILGKVFIGFFKIFKVYRIKFRPLNPQKYWKY
jgi:hypothetical protein